MDYLWRLKILFSPSPHGEFPHETKERMLAMNSDARQQLESLRGKIDALNSRKSLTLTAWEGEKKRRPDDMDLQFMPEEIKAINKILFNLYSERDDILKSHPELKDEYGGIKKKQGKSPLNVTKSSTSKIAKKQHHEANLARRREEDRARASQRTSGKRK